MSSTWEPANCVRRHRAHAHALRAPLFPRPLALVVQGHGALLPLLLAATSHPAGASYAHHPHLHLLHPHLLLSTRSTSSSSNPSSITTPTPNSTHRQESTLALIWAGGPIDPGPWPALFYAVGFVLNRQHIIALPHPSTSSSSTTSFTFTYGTTSSTSTTSSGGKLWLLPAMSIGGMGGMGMGGTKGWMSDAGWACMLRSVLAAG
ncbi:hypothetical protein DFH08DRAFT_1090011 [Mycena albidolilacea]|uniref:Uncharacterized protein n=1 Tax=Mycena albidolilacea TaxID=1033008 RepID=A0AAD7E7P8_9AGAR|nr:hypothetical protein DFH08DRAFT_1090011 [Mycena albidolilacea]